MFVLAEEKPLQRITPTEDSFTVAANRTDGVAPLSVSFDLTDSIFVNEDALMLAEFMWDFGDDGDPYNTGKGFCPSHVYRDPGIYTARVTGYLDDKTFSDSVTITVSEFSGTTYYISNDGSDETGDGSELNPFASPKYAFDNFTAPNVRFLLRQGDVFSKDSSILFGSFGDDVIEGPVIIDSYRDTSNPDDRKPVIYDTRVDSGYTSIIAFLNCDDFRIINIKFQATGEGVGLRNEDELFPSGIGMSVNGPSSNLLFLDCDVQGAGPHSIKPEGEYIVIQDCTIRDGGSYGVFAEELYNSAFIGLSAQEFANVSPEYTMRLSTHIVKNYIAYCDLRGDYTCNTFQIRGDDSSYNYVWNNQFDRFVGINQTNNEEDETLHHNTFDSNITVMRNYEGNTIGSYNERGFFFSSSNSMCRNNIVYGFDIGFFINTHPLAGANKKLWYYNNTVIALRENNSFIAINKDSRDIELKNNVFYNLADTSGYADKFISVITSNPNLKADLSQIDSDYNIFMGEGWGSEAEHILVGVAYYDNDPTLAIWRSNFNNGIHSQFADALLNTNIDTEDVKGSLDFGFARLSAGSPAIDAGDPNRIYTRFDFFGNERSSNSLGAIGD